MKGSLKFRFLAAGGSVLLLAACESEKPPPPPPPVQPAYVATAAGEEDDDFDFAAMRIWDTIREPDASALEEALEKAKLTPVASKVWRAIAAHRWTEAAEAGDEARVPLRRALRGVLAMSGGDQPLKTRPVAQAYLSVATTAEMPYLRDILLSIPRGGWWNRGGGTRADVLATYGDLSVWLAERGSVLEAAALDELAGDPLPELARPAAASLEKLVDRLARRRPAAPSATPRVAVEVRASSWFPTRRQIEPALLEQLRAAQLDVVAADSPDVDAIIVFRYRETRGSGYAFRGGSGYDLSGTFVTLKVAVLDLASRRLLPVEGVTADASATSLDFGLKEDELESQCRFKVVQYFENKPEFCALGRQIADALASARTAK